MSQEIMPQNGALMKQAMELQQFAQQQSAGIQNFAEAAFKSGLFKSVSNVAQAIVKIQMGRELGIPPMRAMQSIYIVHGNITMNGTLRALILVKLIEKIVADKEEGVIEQIKGHALDEFQRDFTGTKTTEINGVKVSVAKKSWWEYPQDVNQLEVEVAEMNRKLKAAKKAAEIEGRAHRMTNDFGTIRINF